MKRAAFTGISAELNNAFSLFLYRRRLRPARHHLDSFGPIY
jgi:hypothetical protein